MKISAKGQARQDESLSYINFEKLHSITRKNQATGGGYIDGYRIKGVEGYYSLSEVQRHFRKLYYTPDDGGAKKLIESISQGNFGSGDYSPCPNKQAHWQLLRAIVAHKELRQI